MKKHFGNLKNSSEAPDLRDFTELLDRAAENAPFINLYSPEGDTYISDEIIDEQERAVAPLAELPDETVVLQDTKRLPNVVAVEDPAQYPELLRQAAALQMSLANPQEWSEILLEHEMAHANFLLSKCPDVKVFYTVAIFRTIIPILECEDFVPVAAVDAKGKMRKIDIAMTLIAPSQLAASDVAALQALGYESPEEVIARYKKMHTASGRLGLKWLGLGSYGKRTNLFQ